MRTMPVCLAVTVLTALTKTIPGTDGPDSLDGTPKADDTPGLFATVCYTALSAVGAGGRFLARRRPSR